MPITTASHSRTGSVHAHDWTPIKEVIDGKAYNTETANFIHEHLEDDEDDPHHPFDRDQHRYSEQMFRTRLGKFFLVLRNEPYNNPAIEEVDLRDRVIPLEPDQAIKWMEKHCSDKITDYVDIPEAGEPSTTLTLRLDKVLKIRLGAAAIEEGVSMNLWCVRILDAAIRERD